MINFLAKYNPLIIEFGSLQIRWYAVLIITGALLSYYFARRVLIKDGYPKDIIENLFLIALPAGIIGARIWWCISYIGEPQLPDFWSYFAIWDGGLAIQGGVIGGIAAGIWYLKKYRPQLNIAYVLDAAVPQILIAQALGRWGNFFNQEVYGACVTRESLWFVPSFILDQMASGNGGYGAIVGNGIACTGNLYGTPLFLYESVLNILGWILISFIIRKHWKTRISGYLTCLYLVWYGIVRLILEPMRNPQFIMTLGDTGIPTSVFMSILFIIGGFGLGYLFYALHKRKINKQKAEVIEEAKK